MKHIVTAFPYFQGIVLERTDDQCKVMSTLRLSGFPRRGVIRQGIDVTPLETNKSSKHINPPDGRLAFDSSIDGVLKAVRLRDKVYCV